MEKIKKYVTLHFYTLFPLLVVSVLSLFFLMVRLKITHSFFLLFLVWNLFLAVIPFGISFYLRQRNHTKNWHVALYSLVWVLFLPNAPYIITDLIHLQGTQEAIFYIDIIVISSFAIAGMLFYVFSVRDMELVVEHHFGQRFKGIFFAVLPFLCGFGIYLGRFLRFNSWDILQHPGSLLYEVFKIVCFPHKHIAAWVITLGFGILLHSTYRIFKKRLISYIQAN